MQKVSIHRYGPSSGRSLRKYRMKSRMILLLTTGTVLLTLGLLSNKPQEQHTVHTTRHLLANSSGSGVSDNRKNFPEDVLDNKQIVEGGFLLYLMGMSYMFLALAVVCDEFFVPALECMEAKWDIQPDIAGATLMAAGGSAPEVATSFLGTFVSRSNVGFGTIVGSAVFNILFVIACCAFFTDGTLKLTAWPLFRDTLYYVLSLSVLAVFYGASSRNKIEAWEAVVLFLMYILYVIYVWMGPRLQVFFAKWVPAFKPEMADTPSKIIKIGRSRTMSISEKDKFGFQMPRKRINTYRTTIMHMNSDAGLQPLRQRMIDSSCDNGAIINVAKTMISGGRNLTKDEYVSLLNNLSEDAWSEEDMSNSFLLLDANKDGEVAGAEILEWLQSDPLVETRIREKLMEDVGITKADHSTTVTKEQVESYVKLPKISSKSLSDWKDLAWDGDKLPWPTFSNWVVTTFKKEWSSIEEEGLSSFIGNQPARVRNSVVGASLREQHLPSSSTVDADEHTENSDGQVVENEAFQVESDIGDDAPRKMLTTASQIPEVIIEDEEDEDDGPIEWPEWNTRGNIVKTLLTAPMMIPMLFTIPDVRNEEPGLFLGGLLGISQKKLYIVAFLMSIGWIAVWTYFMVWWAIVLGDAWGIPDEVMGLIFLAAGTSIPDLLTSVIVAQRGHGDMAVSSSIGSNIFDITFGLPLPWIIFTAINGPVDVTSGELELSISLLIAMVAGVIVLIMISKWTMSNFLGILMMIMYVAFILQHLLRFYL
eukprot:m.49168 g.49168  ORF g.49168 m.49168 type:complete len:762 (-) comp10601_c0_seq1:1034-3319(-)